MKKDIYEKDMLLVANKAHAVLHRKHDSNRKFNIGGIFWDLDKGFFANPTKNGGSLFLPLTREVSIKKHLGRTPYNPFEIKLGAIKTQSSELDVFIEKQDIPYNSAHLIPLITGDFKRFRQVLQSLVDIQRKANECFPQRHAKITELRKPPESHKKRRGERKLIRFGIAA